MKSQHSAKRQVSAAELDDLAATMVTVLKDRGDVPEAIWTLSPKQYTDFVEKLNSRLNTLRGRGAIVVDRGILDRLLKPTEVEPTAKQVTEFYTALTRLAGTSDSTGDAEVRVLERALSELPGTATDIDRYFRKVGPIWQAMARLAAEWCARTGDGTPTSAAAGALARIIALHASDAAGRVAAARDGVAVADLAQSLESVRVRDLRGENDPLLRLIAPTLNALALSAGMAGTAVVPVQIANGGKPPVRQTTKSGPDRIREALQELTKGILEELVALEELRRQVSDLKGANDSLSGSLVAEQRTAGDLLRTNQTLQLRVSQATEREEKLQARVTEAEAGQAEWKLESEREIARSAVMLDQRLSAVRNEILGLITRLGAPINGIVEKATLEGMDHERLRVNVPNFLGQLQRIADRLQPPSSGTAAASDEKGPAG